MSARVYLAPAHILIVDANAGGPPEAADLEAVINHAIGSSRDTMVLSVAIEPAEIVVEDAPL